MSSKSILALAGMAAVFVSLNPSPAEAHRRWLLPSNTVLAGEEETVSVDAAISNNLFGFDHHAMPLDDVSVVGPDGQTIQPAIIGSGEYRSVFDVPLKQQGTYRIASVSDGMMGFYEVDGQRHRWRGTRAEMATALPANATNVRTFENSSRTETFVTLGAPDDRALQPVGRGIEMVPVTHPNDLVASEPAQMRFLVDGQPAAGLEVEFVQGGTKYRDEAGSRMLVADAAGLVTLEAPVPGMYYLEASRSNDDEGAGQTAPRRMSYTAVLEFLPL